MRIIFLVKNHIYLKKCRITYKINPHTLKVDIHQRHDTKIEITNDAAKGVLSHSCARLTSVLIEQLLIQLLCRLVVVPRFQQQPDPVYI